MLPSSYQVMQVLLIASAAVLFMLLGICVYLDRKVNEYYRAWQATRQALDAANSLDDVNERRRQSAVPLRDVRYFAERVRTAQLTPPPGSNDVVAFGHTVTFERDDGRTQTFRIVGEDEANPAEGSISHGSPVALALVGKSVGDVARLGPREIEILSIA